MAKENCQINRKYLILIKDQIRELNSILLSKYPKVKLDVQHWGDFEDGCWIHFMMPDHPFISITLDNTGGSTSYDVSSVWSGTEYGGSRFGTPMKYYTIDDMIVRLNRIICEYNEACIKAKELKRKKINNE